MSILRHHLITAFALLALATAAGAIAQDDTASAAGMETETEGVTALLPKWEFEFGSFFTSTTTDVRADSQRGSRGTAVNLEDVLGLDDSETVLRLSAARRFGKRHQVRFRYTEFSRDGQVEVPFEIRFRDIAFPVNAVVTTEWDFTFSDLGYTYYFSNNERTAWGVLAAVARWDYDIVVRGSDERINRDLASDIDIDELVPEIGLTVRHRLAPKFHFRGLLTGLRADLGDEEVRIVNANLRFDYRAFKNVGIAIAGTYSELDYEDIRGRFIGDYDYNVSGIQVFIPIYLD